MIVRRSRTLGAVALACLAVGVPANLSAASDFASAQARLSGASRSVLVSIVHVPLSATAPGSLHPDPVGAPAVTLQWLRTALRDGKLPAAGVPSAGLLARDRLRLSLMQLDAARGGECPTLTAPTVRYLARGASVGIGDGAVKVVSLPSAGGNGVVMLGNVLFRSSAVQHTLVSVVGSLTVRISPLRGHRAQLC